MGFRRVSEAEMRGKGNLGRPDTPGVSTTEMQRIMDELPREVLAPAFNELAGQLEAKTAAGQLGASVPGTGLPGSTAATVQGVLNALLAYMQAHQQRTNNPHGVTAAQTGAYTKAETDAAISQRVVEIGASDMVQAVYDPAGRQEDVFAAIDAAARQSAAEDQKLREADAARAAETQTLAGRVQVFTCTLWANGWTASGTTYTQTVTCSGLLATHDLEAPQVPVTGVKATDAALKEGLDILCEAGNSGVTLNGQLKWTCYGAKPTVDLPLRLRRVVSGSILGGGSGSSAAGGTISVAPALNLELLYSYDGTEGKTLTDFDCGDANLILISFDAVSSQNSTGINALACRSDRVQYAGFGSVINRASGFYFKPDGIFTQTYQRRYTLYNDASGSAIDSQAMVVRKIYALK